jgi:hypothetical protein
MKALVLGQQTEIIPPKFIKIKHYEKVHQQKHLSLIHI